MQQVKSKVKEISSVYGWITFACAIPIYILKQPLLTLEDWIGVASYAFTAATIVFSLFVKFAWKWPYISRLVDQPNIQGTWVGTLYYNYEGKDLEKEIKVNIKQDYFNISVGIETDVSTSYAYNSGFCVTGDSHQYYLNYNYSHSPNSKTNDTNHAHCGSVQLKYDNDKKTLKGIYWTRRKTIGDITLSKQ
jgi:hypothetical protein